MAALQCEICGGKLIGKPGGVFECDSCGMEYSTEWAKAKVQEIRGTVKIEGPVEVTGTVKVEGGGPTLEALRKRAKIAQEDRNWRSADQLYRQITEMDPESPEGYLGLVMVYCTTANREEFANAYIAGEVPRNHTDLARAKQFGDQALKDWLKHLEEKRVKKQAAQVKKQAALEEQKLALEAERRAKLPAARARAEKAASLLNSESLIPWGSFLRRVDGTVVRVNFDKAAFEEVKGVHNIVALSSYHDSFIGVREDGTVTVAYENKNAEISPRWRGIKAAIRLNYENVGLRGDGTVVSDQGSAHLECDKDDSFADSFVFRDWKDIVQIADFGYTLSDGKSVLGLKSDGTVLSTGRVGNKVYAENVKKIFVLDSGKEVVLLRQDGTLGNIDNPRDDRKKWTDVVSITRNLISYAGVTSIGTALFYTDAQGTTEIADQCNRSAVAAVSTSGYTFGRKTAMDGNYVLMADGKIYVKSLYFNSLPSDWSNMLAIAACGSMLVGLRADGSVLVFDDKKSWEIPGLKLFDDPDTWEQEYDAAQARHEAALKQILQQEKEEKEKEDERKKQQMLRAKMQKQERIAALNTEKAAIQAELPKIKGLFSGGKRRELEARLAQIEKELSKL